jgi:hypothetical protein
MSDPEPSDELPGFSIPPGSTDMVYSAIASRRTAFDTMMWQVPALGLAAQAFLLTIAYGSSSSNAARFISGALSIIVALVAIQTMLKHRANEKTDNLILEQIETRAGIRLSRHATPHSPPAVRGKAIENELIYGCLEKQKSVRLWLTSLCGFAAAGSAAIVLTLCDASILAG